MTDPIQEIRVRRAEAKAQQAHDEGMADGWTEQHIDALLAEIDRLGALIDVVDQAKIIDRALGPGCVVYHVSNEIEPPRPYGDRRIEETINRAAALVPPEMQQWFLDEMHGVKRVGGKVVER